LLRCLDYSLSRSGTLEASGIQESLVLARRTSREVFKHVHEPTMVALSHGDDDHLVPARIAASRCANLPAGLNRISSWDPWSRTHAACPEDRSRFTRILPRSEFLIGVVNDRDMI
jgi:hypothetical protein